MANSKADGSVNFDTKIDTSGFEKGLKQIDKSSEKASKNVEKDTEKSSKNAEKKAGDAADGISKSFAKSSGKMQSSMQEAGEKSEKIFKDTETAAKSAMDGIDGKTSGLADSIKSGMSHVGESVSDTISGMGDFNNKFDDAMSDSIKSVGGLVAAIGGIGAAVIASGTQAEQAANQVAAATGLTGDALKEVQDISQNVYKDNFGDSMEDAADAVAVTYQQTKLVGDELQTAAENAMLLDDTFGYDVNESIRTAKALADNFGISIEEAYNLMAQGAQKGLDKNGDMLDTLNEYAVHYSQLGYTVEDFFGSLENGAASGAFSIDKIGDTMKEFGIRVKDTSTSTQEAFQLLGYTGDSIADMQAKFAAGGESAREATSELLGQQQNVEDDVTRNQIGVDLFGTMWEDLGEEAVYSLLNTQTEISNTTDALGQLNDVKYDDVMSQLTALKRQAETEVLQPFAQKLMPKVKEDIEWVSKNMDDLVDDIVPIGKAVATAFAVKKVTDFGTTAIKTINSVSSVVKLVPSVLGPMGMAVTGVTAAVAGVAYATYRDIKYANDYAVDLDSYTQHLIDKQDKLNQKTEEQNQIRAEWEDRRNSATDNVDREYTYYQNLSDALENVVDKNGKIKEGYENRAKVITGELSEALGVEIDIVDGQIQEYDNLKSKIEEVMATKKANALLSANEESYIDAQQQLSDAGSTYSESLDNQKSLERRLTKMQAAQSAFQNLSNYGGGTDAYYAAVDRFVSSYGEMLDVTQSDIANNSTKVFQQIQKSIDETSSSLDDAKKDVKDNLSNVIAYQSEIKNYEDMQEAIASGDADAIAECNARLLNNLQTAETGTRESLQKQMDDAHQYWEDLKSKYDDGVAGITQSMVDAAYQTYVITNQEFNDFKANASSAGYEGASNYTSSFSAGVTDNSYQITDALGNVSRMLSEQAAELYQWGMDNGYNYAAGLAAGINDPGNTLAAEEASKALANAATNSTRTTWDEHSPSKVAKKLGGYYSEGLAEGIRDGSGETSVTAEQMAQDVINASQLPVSPYNEIAYPVQQPRAAEQTQTHGTQQAQTGGDWIFPIYMAPNTHVLDTIVLSAKDRANAISGGTEF
ncbi:phage tail tape measure protein [Ruminococcus callidus]|uniref:phage tail tape measure protein n=1 Tax=Ruminococcus callidus TaxID=40519 RepID=UPI003522A8B5